MRESSGWRARADWLLGVGLGNPGAVNMTRIRVTTSGFEIARALIDRWELPKPKSRYRGLLISEGRTGPGGPQVARC